MNPSDIKSAQFLDAYYPLVDGVVNTVHNYANLMNKSAYSCVVAPKGHHSFNDKVLPYDVFRTASIKVPIAEYVIPTPKADRGLRTFLNVKKIDIFHAHSPFTEGSFAASCAKKLSIPCVATFHSKYYDDALHITHSKAIARIVANNIVRFYNSVDSVWSCSEGTAETLRSYGYKGDIFVMDNGSSMSYPDNPDELRENARKQFDLPADKNLLLFIGHQIWHKNLGLILDTFKLLCDQSDDYILVIVGDGYDADKIRKYADSLSFPDGAVRFVGKIVDKDLIQGLYLSAGLFFFPSVYDNSPLVVREAASLGVPSLLTEGSNAAEAVKKDFSGFTAAENKVAMYSEIVKAFSDRQRLKEIGENARQTIPKTWEQIVSQVQEKYAEIIEKYRFEHQLT
ncbi:MAG: glycosyltransferase [Ruminococcus sp.]|nr:glycosyltransferase [Ruminococcus sp.]